MSRFPSFEEALFGLDERAMAIMTLAAVVLLLFRKFGSSGFFRRSLQPETLARHPYASVFGDYYWFASCFLFLGAITFFCLRSTSLGPKEMGTGLGDRRFGFRWVAILFVVMVPIVFIASRNPAFSRYYPMNKLLGGQAVTYFSGGTVPDSFVLYFLLYEFLYAVYFVGWEYFFRGFLTFGLYERFGVNGIFVANIPFVLLHAGKPFPEALSSVLAGIGLGLFALRARSFWYCWMVHAMVAWTMDLCALQQRVSQAARAVTP